MAWTLTLNQLERKFCVGSNPTSVTKLPHRIWVLHSSLKGINEVRVLMWQQIGKSYKWFSIFDSDSKDIGSNPIFPTISYYY